MDELLEISEKLLEKVSLKFKRYLINHVDWSNRLIGIKGARGTGKTTMLLQWLKEISAAGERSKEMSDFHVAYFSLDELYFTKNTLIDTAAMFYRKGGKLLVLDEVHKYHGWAREIKNLYDRYDDLKIVFTGSSILDIARQEGDLSRRALMYELPGLSFREYLELRHNLKIAPITMHDILHNRKKALKLASDFKPLAYFDEYLKNGYYPFFETDRINYHARLRQLIRTIVEFDMAELRGFDIRQARKMLQLLYVVSQQVPFKPNINNLASKTEIHRNTINNYLYFLQDARLLSLLQPSGISVATLQKPEKIYMQNTNMLYALSEEKPSIGTIREIFFLSNVQAVHKVNHSTKCDFLVDDKYYFEVGGKTKNLKQIEGLTNAFVVKDELEIPVGNSLPLWMFGMLY